MHSPTVNTLSQAALQQIIDVADLSRVDFADGYSGLIRGTKLTADQVAQAMFGDLPGFARVLMAVRDRVVAPFGVKASTTLARLHGEQKCINFFPVLSESAELIVLGGNDVHLDFRIYISVQAEGAGQRISASTLVKLNNRLGRLYLSAIMPFHRYLARYAIDQAVERLDSGGIDDTAVSAGF
jgi:hypothetical protein